MRKVLNDVSLEIIQKCLNQCMHCSSNSCYKSEAILDFDIIKEVIEDIEYLGGKRLCLSGGEPFLHPEIIDIIGYATSKELFLDIYSSGIIGTPGREKAISKELLYECKKNGLRRIIFNLQSQNPETYDSIMHTKNNFPLVIESIKNSQMCGIETEIHFVPMKQNYKEIKDVVKLAKDLKVNQVSFLKLVTHGRAKENKTQIELSEQETIHVQKELYKIKKDGSNIRIGLPLLFPEKQNMCHAVKEKIYIKFDGSVFGCEAFKYIKFFDDINNEILPDNVYSKRLREIYCSSPFLLKSKELIKKYSCDISNCENCPVQKYMKETL